MTESLWIPPHRRDSYHKCLDASLVSSTEDEEQVSDRLSRNDALRQGDAAVEALPHVDISGPQIDGIDSLQFNHNPKVFLKFDTDILIFSVSITKEMPSFVLDSVVARLGRRTSTKHFASSHNPFMRKFFWKDNRRFRKWRRNVRLRFCFRTLWRNRLFSAVLWWVHESWKISSYTMVDIIRCWFCLITWLMFTNCLFIWIFPIHSSDPDIRWLFPRIF